MFIYGGKAVISFSELKPLLSFLLLSFVFLPLILLEKDLFSMREKYLEITTQIISTSNFVWLL